MMQRREFLQGSALAVGGLLLNRKGFAEVASSQTRYAEGRVFHDRSGKGIYNSGQPGIAGVGVSNGRQVVVTDRDGRYRIPVTEDCVLFVIKPSGWSVPLDEQMLPQFHYIHKPNGSPATRYDGVKPTGPLPSEINFPLRPQKEERKFRMIIFGDPQPRDQAEISYIAHDVIEQCAKDAADLNCKFGISLGDEMFDNLTLYASLNGVISTIGLPWYNTVGNHDMNYDVPNDFASTETFQKTFGPTNYSFNYADVHFVVLDNVMFHGKDVGGYHGEFAAAHLDFLRNDLKYVPENRLVVIAMHIPITEVINREELYRIIQNRPHTFSMSAHTHVQNHFFLTEKDGWNGATPHHHLNHATVCGSWWEGAPDERGIPHATMADGVPNGYSIIEFDGSKYKIMFRPASRPADEQMLLWLPESIKAGESAELVANVFAGSERSKVEMRIGDGAWNPMTNTERVCPFYAKIKELEAGPNPPPGRKLPAAQTSNHIWTARLPADLKPGTHRVSVRSRDMWGQVYQSSRIVNVKA